MGSMTDKVPKRPRDPNQLAKLMVDIATGEESEVSERIVRGSPGGLGRAEALPQKRRIEIAQKGAIARWSKAKVSTSTEPE